jgi:hypothetical protein
MGRLRRPGKNETRLGGQLFEVNVRSQGSDDRRSKQSKGNTEKGEEIEGLSTHCDMCWGFQVGRCEGLLSVFFVLPLGYLESAPGFPIKVPGGNYEEDNRGRKMRKKS